MGNGGSVNIQAGGVLTIGANVNVNTGPNGGVAGTIIAHGSQIIVANSVLVTANGGSSSTKGGLVTLIGDAQAGTIGQSAQLVATSNGQGGTLELTNILSLQSSTILNASAIGQGSGGAIKVTNNITGGLGFAMPSSAVIKANGTGSAGNGGNITFNLSSTQGNVVQIAGAVNANSTGTGANGSVLIDETDTNALQITNNGKFSANKGTITFEGSADVSFAVTSITGKIVATGASINSGTLSSGDLTIQQLKASGGNISITNSGSGDILSSGSSETITASGSLSLLTEEGGIGVSGTNLLTQVSSVTAKNNNQSGSGGVYISNTDSGSGSGFGVNFQAANGGLFIETTGAMTLLVGDSSSVTGGGMTVIADNGVLGISGNMAGSGQLTIGGGLKLQSTNNQINMTGMSQITTTGGDQLISAYGTAAESCKDDKTVNNQNGCRPAGASVPTGLGNVWWGTLNSVDLVNVAEQETVAANRNIVFNANGHTTNGHGDFSIDITNLPGLITFTAN